MPFTLAHLVVAPPISTLSRNRLPVASIAIGSITPDALRLFSTAWGLQSHEWHSIYQLNLYIGLIGCVIWYLIYRPTLYRWLSLEDRLEINSLKKFINFAICCALSLILGNLTHILWDGFTHLDSRTLMNFDWMAFEISFLNQTYPVHFILQLISSILPLPLIFWFYKKYINAFHLKSKQHVPQSYSGFIICMACSFIVGCVAILWFIQDLSFEMWNQHLYYFLGRIFNKFSQAFLISFTIFCLFSQILNMKNKKLNSLK